MLTNRQQAALAALLTNPTRAAAARACGLSEKTLWMYEHQNAEFQQALADARAGVIQQAAQSLGTCYPRAVEVLRQLMDDPKQAASVRVSAARALLEFGLRYAEAADFDRRLRDLEGGLKNERARLWKSGAPSGPSGGIAARVGAAVRLGGPDA